MSTPGTGTASSTSSSRPAAAPDRVIVTEPQNNGVAFAVRGAHPHLVIAQRAADIQGLQLLESCSSRWIFDVTTRRFRRTPRDTAVWLKSPDDWMDYHRLDVDHDRSCFVVGLDEGGTRKLRAWLHSEPCDRCGRPRLARHERGTDDGEK